MANNQYVNKVVFGDETLIDLSSDTITAGALLQGYTAHDQTGALITGTIEDKSPIPGFNNGRFEISFAAGYYGGKMHFETIQVPPPSSGTNSITIQIPNGTTNPNMNNMNDWIPITFTVDTNGNSEVTDDTIPATGVSF